MNIHAKLHPLCLDNDPQFIILELMEGGDLLWGPVDYHR